jgi:hypothetical protein
MREYNLETWEHTIKFILVKLNIFYTLEKLKWFIIWNRGSVTQASCYSWTNRAKLMAQISIVHTWHLSMGYWVGCHIYMCLYMLLNSIVKLMMIVLAYFFPTETTNNCQLVCRNLVYYTFRGTWRRVNKRSNGVMGLVLVLAPYQIRCITAAPMHMLECIFIFYHKQYKFFLSLLETMMQHEERAREWIDRWTQAAALESRCARPRVWNGIYLS